MLASFTEITNYNQEYQQQQIEEINHYNALASAVVGLTDTMGMSDERI
jgi:hypothetical protein